MSDTPRPSNIWYIGASDEYLWHVTEIATLWARIFNLYNDTSVQS